MKTAIPLLAMVAALALSACATKQPKVNTGRLEANVARQGATLGEAQQKTLTIEEKLAEIQRLANER
jgi:uncharacterized lipoprotein YmbA